MPLKKLLTIFVLMLLLTSASSVKAANNLTWDTDYNRSRQTVDSMNQLYSAKPIPVSIGDAVGTWLWSMSTPVVYGNTLYQYAYNTDTNTGYLVAVDISKPNPQSPSDFHVLWNAAFHADADERVDGSPGPSISSDGQYMSIAVGEYLYTWPITVGGSPNTPDSSGHMKNLSRYNMTGNPGQTTNLIAMSPAITSKSYNWQGTDTSTFATVTFSAPATCAGSWNGGFTAVPLFVPGNIDPSTVQVYHYCTTSTDPSWSGEIFTSSPAIQGNGAGDVLFGVDGGYPTLFSFHPSSFTIDHIGDGIIQYGIASAPAIDPSTGDIYVPDKMANIYHFRSDGTYVNKNTDLSNGNLTISNVAIDQNYIYAVKSGYGEVHAIDKDTMLDKQTIFNSSGGFIDPSVAIDTGSGTSIVAVNDSNGYVKTYSFDSASGGIFVSGGNLSTSAKGYAPPPYVSVIMDAGPNKFIASWTNDTVAGGECGALEFWVPQGGDLTAKVVPSSTQPGSKCTLYADTSVDNTLSKVVAQLPDANGNPVPITNATDMTYTTETTDSNGKPEYHYEVQFTAPSVPGNFTIPVQLQYTAPGNSLAPINTIASYQVVKPAGGIAADSGATLTLNSYALPENHIAKGGSFKQWPVSNLSAQHPDGTTFLGDTILSNLAVNTPALPDPQNILVDSYLTSATVTHPEGYEDSVSHQWLTRSTTENMTTSGMKATWQFEQTWAGWEPGNYVTDSPAASQGSLTLNSAGEQDTIHVDYTVHVDYKYPVVVCTAIPTPTGAVEACTTYWYLASMDVNGSTSANLTTWGTDFLVVPVIAGTSN